MKPRIWFEFGIWWCRRAGIRFGGVGISPKEAFEDWKLIERSRRYIGA